jgi:hypothetical protein
MARRFLPSMLCKAFSRTHVRISMLHQVDLTLRRITNPCTKAGECSTVSTQHPIELSPNHHVTSHKIGVAFRI